MGYYRTIVTNPFTRGRKVYPRYPNRKPARARVNPSGGIRKGARVQRRGRTYTNTQQRRKRRTNRVVKHGDNSSASFTKIGSSWSPVLRTLYKKVIGRQMLSNHAWGSYLSGVGTQNVIEDRYFDKVDLDLMTTAANGGVPTNVPMKLFIGSFTQKCYFKNQSNAVGKLMIYDIIFKRTTPTTAFDHGRELWLKGFTDLGSGSYTRIGATPNQSGVFRNYCKIHKVTVVDLEPGQQHTHIVKRSFNKVFDSARWSINVGQSIAGLTGSTMYAFHGSLIHESATPSSVTFSDMRLDVVVSNEMHFGYIQDNIPTYSIRNTIPSTIVDPDFMGEAGDVDANVINA